LAIDYFDMPYLEELEIDGICNHIPITGLVGPSLRALRLHCEDASFSVNSAESQLSQLDLMAAVRLAPNLVHLELDVGYLDSLWQPVAIPSVDVDLKQYTFLNTIGQFRKLRFLRLFPPFVAKDSPRDSRTVPHRLPISDYQAIRIFEHVRRGARSLSLLSIAAIPSIMDVDTMFWEVKPHGNETILTTGHRTRNYRDRQTWLGERKIRSEIRRFRVPPRYLPDFGGWLLTRNDRVIPGSLSSDHEWWRA
jgi:hypothetical protein